MSGNDILQCSKEVLNVIDSGSAASRMKLWLSLYVQKMISMRIICLR
jgi:hypothetical protein